MDDFYVDIKKYIDDNQIYNDDYVDIEVNNYFCTNKRNLVNESSTSVDYEQFYANYDFIKDKNIYKDMNNTDKNS